MAEIITAPPRLGIELKCAQSRASWSKKCHTLRKGLSDEKAAPMSATLALILIGAGIALTAERSKLVRVRSGK
jgi:hypothetical protein